MELGADEGEGNGAASAVRNLIRGSVHHFLNDGYTWSLYPLLPLIARDFGLSYAGSGAVKTVLNSLLSATSIPFGILAERTGELLVLTLGTTAFTVGIALMALAPSFAIFLGITLAAGAGGGASHPVGSSLVSRTSPRGRINSYIAMLNVSGDLGKAIIPALAGLLAATFGWRVTFLVLGTCGAAVALYVGRSSLKPGSRRDRDRIDGTDEISESRDDKKADTTRRGLLGIENWARFGSLNAVGMIDSVARSGAVVFLAFILAEKGFSIGATGAMLSLTAIGGAFGKFGCGPLGDRIGQRAAVIWTEILTAIFLVLVVSAGYYWMFPVVFFMGAFLNGTSSVLYALVPRLTTKVSLNRGFGFYYTTTLATSGVAPLAVGLLGDSIGLHGTYYVMAGILLATIPLMSLVVPRSG